MRLIFRPQAIEDLRSIHRFIAADNPAAARQHVREIRRRCAILCDHPQAGRARDDFGAGIRTLAMLGNVVVAYRVLPGAVRIARIFYAGQDYEAILRGETDA